MPINLDSASQNIAQFGNSATSGSVTQNHTVNPLADGLAALMFVYVMGNNSVSAATLSASFGGDAMSQQGSTVYDDSNYDALACFALTNPPTGIQSWTASVSGMTGVAGGFWMMAGCVSYANVLSIGTPVTAGGSAATANSVTVSSVGPAYRVVTAHAVRTPYQFSGYNLNTQAMLSSEHAYIAYLLSLFTLPFGSDPRGGELIVGDSPGAATITGTATQPSTANWSAIGIPLTPAPVLASASLTLSTSMTVSASLQRDDAPSPLRTWTIQPVT